MEVAKELGLLGPVAKRILRLVVNHGGDMNHMDIVRQLPDVSDADMKEAFQQCRDSTLLWDTWPSAFNPVHTWKVSQGAVSDLAKKNF